MHSENWLLCTAVAAINTPTHAFKLHPLLPSEKRIS